MKRRRNLPKGNYPIDFQLHGGEKNGLFDWELQKALGLAGLMLHQIIANDYFTGPKIDTGQCQPALWHEYSMMQNMICQCPWQTTWMPTNRYHIPHTRIPSQV